MIGFIMIYIYFVFNFMLLLNSFLITNFANVYLIILDGSWLAARIGWFSGRKMLIFDYIALISKLSARCAYDR